MKQKHTHRYREKTGGCQRRGMNEIGEEDQRIQMLAKLVLKMTRILPNESWNFLASIF